MYKSQSKMTLSRPNFEQRNIMIEIVSCSHTHTTYLQIIMETWFRCCFGHVVYFHEVTEKSKKPTPRTPTSDTGERNKFEQFWQSIKISQFHVLMVACLAFVFCSLITVIIWLAPGIISIEKTLYKMSWKKLRKIILDLVQRP